MKHTWPAVDALSKELICLREQAKRTLNTPEGQNGAAIGFAVTSVAVCAGALVSLAVPPLVSDVWAYATNPYFASNEIHSALTRPTPEKIIFLKKGDVKVPYKIHCIREVEPKNGVVSWRATAKEIGFDSAGKEIELRDSYYRNQRSVSAPACALIGTDPA